MVGFLLREEKSSTFEIRLKSFHSGFHWVYIQPFRVSEIIPRDGRLLVKSNRN